MKKLIPLFLLSLLTLTAIAQTPKNNELSLYFIPAPVRLDWSSPASLALSTLKSRLSFKSRFLGHVFVELKCEDKWELTGMVGQNFDYLNQLLVNQKGLGILFHSFDGRLEDKGDVDREINELAATGERLNFVRFKLNQGQCQRALSYLNEYREKNVGRYYGLANRPLYAEGAGCSAFGASFPDALNIMEQEMKDSWSQTVNIPLKFAGPPLREEGTNILTLMMNASKWASDGEPSVPLHFWSPDFMYEWVKNKVKNPPPTMSVINRDKAQGIEIDKSFLPVPLEPVWRQVVNK